MAERVFCSSCKHERDGGINGAAKCPMCGHIHFTFKKPARDPRQRLDITLPSGWNFVCWMPIPMKRKDYDFIYGYFRLVKDGVVNDAKAVTPYLNADGSPSEDR